jgi:hypothetical protein
MSHIPFRRQIFPRRVPLRDQPLFLRSIPALQLLFAIDRLIHIIKRFVINQPMTSIPSGESLDHVVPVFPNPPMEIVAHPDVQNSRPARDHVYEIVMLLHNSTALSSRPSEVVAKAISLRMEGPAFCRRRIRSRQTAGPSIANIARRARDLLRSDDTFNLHFLVAPSMAPFRSLSLTLSTLPSSW